MPSALHYPSTDCPLVSASAPPQVRGELLRERVQQLEAQEGRFAESLVSLQFQKAARMAKTLGAYTALLSIQDLLLEELSESETLTRSACVQILESHSSVSAGGGGGRPAWSVVVGWFLGPTDGFSHGRVPPVP